MANLRLQSLVLTLVLAFTLGVTACTRSASTPPPEEGAQETPSVQSETQATMDAVRSAILTQTAQAEGAGAATATPAEATVEPTGEAAATATPMAEIATATPGYIEYTVQPGDWIFKIARDYGVDPQAIIDLNDLTNPADISPGIVLKIPTAPTPAPAPTSAGETPQATGTPSGEVTIHIVQPGEWIWQIARTYGVDPQAIIDANELTSPATIYPGQELIIP